LSHLPLGLLRRETVSFILKKEILSQQQTQEKTEGSLYPNGRNHLSTTKQGEEGRMFSLP
jgi:hypothetical protein